ELEEDKKQSEHAAQLIVNALHDTKQRNAELEEQVAAMTENWINETRNASENAVRNSELVAALRKIRDLDDDSTAEDCATMAGEVLALTLAESAAPAPKKQPWERGCEIATRRRPDRDGPEIGLVHIPEATPAPHPDTVRLEFLGQQDAVLVCNVTSFWFEYPNGTVQTNRHDSVRGAIDEMAAIDAAMEARK
ncbi:MAG: hypothetical protein WCH43_11180, partial [Verrucomicrobiota bacterium]